MNQSGEWVLPSLLVYMSVEMFWNCMWKLDTADTAENLGWSVFGGKFKNFSVWNEPSDQFSGSFMNTDNWDALCLWLNCVIVSRGFNCFIKSLSPLFQSNSSSLPTFIFLSSSIPSLSFSLVCFLPLSLLDSRLQRLTGHRCSLL